MVVEKNLRLTINFYKNHCLPVAISNKNNLSNQVVPITYTLEKNFFIVAILLRFVSHFFLDRVKNIVVFFGLYEYSLNFRGRRKNNSPLQFRSSLKEMYFFGVHELTFAGLKINKQRNYTGFIKSRSSTNVTEVRRFLGSVNDCSQFIPGYAELIQNPYVN